MAIVRGTPRSPSGQEERTRSRDRDGLVAALSDPDPAVRRWAARDLVPLGESRLLADRLSDERESSVREVLLTGLARIGDAAAVEGLVLCLRSEDVALRNEAIEAMKNLPEAMAPLMASLLADPDPDVRIFAVNVLESLRHPDVESWLLQVVETDPHVNVCATAVDLLGEVGTDRATEPLRALNRRFGNEPYIAFAIDLALKRIGGP